MSNLIIMRKMQLAAAAALLLAAGAVQAQWMWIDAKGLKQVSDRPPPPSVPLKSILKSPVPMTTDSASSGLAAGGLPDGVKVMTVAEREADYRKRMAEKTAAAEKASAQPVHSDERNKACRAAQANRDLINSGQRIVAGPGRSEYMNDAERAKQKAKAEMDIGQLCS